MSEELPCEVQQSLQFVLEIRMVRPEQRFQSKVFEELDLTTRAMGEDIRTAAVAARVDGAVLQVSAGEATVLVIRGTQTWKN